MLAWVREGQQAFAGKPSDEQAGEVFTYRPDLWDRLVDYIYAHWDVFRLLVRCNDIGCYEDMLHEIIVSLNSEIVMIISPRNPAVF